MPGCGFGRCDGHHEMIDFSLEKAAACACFTRLINGVDAKRKPLARRRRQELDAAGFQEAPARSGNTDTARRNAQQTGSNGLLPPSPPAEKASASGHQTGQTCAHDGAWDGRHATVDISGSTGVREPRWTRTVREGFIGRLYGGDESEIKVIRWGPYVGLLPPSPPAEKANARQH